MLHAMAAKVHDVIQIICFIIIICMARGRIVSIVATLVRVIIIFAASMLGTQMSNLHVLITQIDGGGCFAF